MLRIIEFVCSLLSLVYFVPYCVVHCMFMFHVIRRSLCDRMLSFLNVALSVYYLVRSSFYLFVLCCKFGVLFPCCFVTHGVCPHATHICFCMCSVIMQLGVDVLYLALCVFCQFPSFPI